MPHHIAVLALLEDHQWDGAFNFDAPHEQADFDLNLPAADHQHELQQMNNMIKDMHDYGMYADAVDIVFDEELEDSNIEEDEHTNITRKTGYDGVFPCLIPKFIEMVNIIHMDEKWFNTTYKYMKCYMLPKEEDPHRIVRNKNRIGKVMFLSAVGRPMYDDVGNCIFDGKIGLWPFVRKELAKGRSRNRGRGAGVTKPIKVNQTTMWSYLIGKVLDAIVRRWPWEHAGTTIGIQQDNAPSHVPVNDEEFAAAAAQTGLNIRLINQPANSPYLNVLDLGFFNSLRSLTYDRVSKNLDDLIANVQHEFDNYNPDTLNRVFLTLQGCLIEMMKDGGGNNIRFLTSTKIG